MSAHAELRVLHVVNSLDAGGMENGVINIARGLAPRGITTKIACLDRRGRFAERLAPEATTVLGKGAGFTPRAVLALAREISTTRPHILHTHNLGPLIYAAPATLWGTRRPIIHGEHAHFTEEEKTARRLRQRRVFYSACRVVHTVAHNVTEEISQLDLRRAETIVNGVETDRFIPADRRRAREKFAIPADAIVIGLVGRFGPYKRHDALIAAFEKIATQHPRACLFLVGGGGSEEERIRDRAAASPQSARIHFSGFMQEPLAAYQTLDLLAIPSTNEGLSNAALEAMSCGVPILGNLGCGHENIMTPGTHGWVLDLRTDTDLATALAAALADPQRLVDFGLAARTSVAERFSINAMLDAYEKLYRRVAAR